jgi:hypothetical protein
MIEACELGTGAEFRIPKLAAVPVLSPEGIESHHRILNEFIGTFSDAVVVETGDYLTIYVSGQIGNDASSKATAKAFEEEAQLCLAISPCRSKHRIVFGDHIVCDVNPTQEASQSLGCRVRRSPLATTA